MSVYFKKTVFFERGVLGYDKILWSTYLGGLALVFSTDFIVIYNRIKVQGCGIVIINRTHNVVVHH